MYVSDNSGGGGDELRGVAVVVVVEVVKEVVEEVVAGIVKVSSLCGDSPAT